MAGYLRLGNVITIACLQRAKFVLEILENSQKYELKNKVLVYFLNQKFRSIYV